MISHSKRVTGDGGDGHSPLVTHKVKRRKGEGERGLTHPRGQHHTIGGNPSPRHPVTRKLKGVPCDQPSR